MDRLFEEQEEESQPPQEQTLPYSPPTHKKEEQLADGLSDMLPDEVWYQVFRNLGPYDLLHVSHTCRRFKEITDDDALWDARGFTTCKTRKENIDMMHERKLKEIIWRNELMQRHENEQRSRTMDRHFSFLRVSYSTPWEVATLLMALLQAVLVALRLDHTLHWPWLACLVPSFLTVLMLMLPVVSYFSYAELFGFGEPNKDGKNFYGGIVHMLGVDMVVSFIDGHITSQVAFQALGVLVLLFMLFCGIRAAYPPAMPASVVLLPVELAVLVAPVIRVVYDNSKYNYESAFKRYSPLVPSVVVAAVLVLVGIQLDEGAPMDWWIPTGVLLCGLVVMAAILFHRQHGTESLLSAIVLSIVAGLCALFVCLETPILNGNCDWPRVYTSFVVFYVVIVLLLLSDLTWVQFLKYFDS